MYAPVSLDNGVFDLEPDDVVVLRVPGTFETDSGQATSFALQEIRATVAGEGPTFADRERYGGSLS